MAINIPSCKRKEMAKLEEVIHVNIRQGNEVKWLLGHGTAHMDKHAPQWMLPQGNNIKVLIFLQKGDY